MNNDVPWPSLIEANARVLDHQRKPHRWANAEPERRFDDLFNLVYDRATLKVAWDRVMGNRGAHTTGVDGVTREIAQRRGRNPFLTDLRVGLKGQDFRPQPVRQTAIPKKSGKLRYPGDLRGRRPARPPQRCELAASMWSATARHVTFTSARRSHIASEPSGIR